MGTFDVGCIATYSGPNWYVSINGSDDNDGSIALPLLQYKKELMQVIVEIRSQLMGTYFENKSQW